MLDYYKRILGETYGRLSLVSLIAVLTLWANSTAVIAEPKQSLQPPNLQKLSIAEQQQLLQKRMKSGAMLGSFGALASLYYAVNAPVIASASKDVVKTQMTTVFAKNYKPTHAELFEAIARQTGTHFKYGENGEWLFNPPNLPLPYSLSTADGWRMEDRKLYVAYIPKEQPVGMDVYVMGRYSGCDDQTLKIYRDEEALSWATMLDKNASMAMMTEIPVDCVNAVYFETTSTARPGCEWRQWVFIKDGQCFVIVSSLDKANRENLLPQVKQMISSFHISKVNQ